MKYGSSELNKKVTEALEQRDRFEDLCREMVNTLTMERNRPAIPEQLLSVSESWKRSFDKILAGET